MRPVEERELSAGRYLTMEAVALGLCLLVRYGAGVHNEVAQIAIALGLFIAAALGAKAWGRLRGSREREATP